MGYKKEFLLIIGNIHRGDAENAEFFYKTKKYIIKYQTSFWVFLKLSYNIYFSATSPGWDAFGKDGDIRFYG